jgi:hypothetical protein
MVPLPPSSKPLPVTFQGTIKPNAASNKLFWFMLEI